MVSWGGGFFCGIHGSSCIPSFSLLALASSGLIGFLGCFASAPASSSSSSLDSFLPFFRLAGCFALLEPPDFLAPSLAGVFGVVNFNLVPVLGVLEG